MCGETWFRLDLFTIFWQSVTKVGHYLFLKKIWRYKRFVDMKMRHGGKANVLLWSVEIKGEWSELQENEKLKPQKNAAEPRHSHFWKRELSCGCQIFSVGMLIFLSFFFALTGKFTFPLVTPYSNTGCNKMACTTRSLVNTIRKYM